MSLLAEIDTAVDRIADAVHMSYVHDSADIYVMEADVREVASKEIHRVLEKAGVEITE